MTLRLAMLIDGDAAGAKKAIAETTAAVTKLNQTSQGALRGVDGAYAQTAQGIAGASARAAAATGAIGQSVTLTTQQMAQMQFQLQDIMVGLASGQSPFMVMMQQGSQMAQAFRAGTGPLAALRAVGAGITAFVTNPLNLAVLGFSAATAAGAYFFSSVLGGSDDANDALAEHEELIERIKLRYGEAAVAAIDYAEDSRDALSFDTTVDADRRRQEFRDQQAQLVRDADTLLLGFTDPFSGKIAGEIETVAAATNRLIADLADGEADLRSYNDEFSRMGRAADAGSAVREVAGEISALIEKVMQFEAAWLKAQGFQQLVTGNPIRSAEDASMAALGHALSTGSLPPVRPRRERTGRTAAEREADRAAREVERQRGAVQGLIGALSEEYSLLGVSERERAVQNELRAAGAAATREERDEIRMLVEGIYDWQEAQDAATERMAELHGVATGVLGAFRQGMEAGKGAAESMGAAVGALSDRLMDLAQNTAFDLIFGQHDSSGGGLLGSLIGGITGSFGGGTSGGGFIGSEFPMQFVAARGAVFDGGQVVPFASGGIVDRPTVFPFASGVGLMGEAGPEAIMPLRRLPSGRLGVEAGGSGGRPAINVTFNNDFRGADVAAVSRIEVMMQEQRARFLEDVGKAIEHWSVSRPQVFGS